MKLNEYDQFYRRVCKPLNLMTYGYFFNHITQIKVIYPGEDLPFEQDTNGRLVTDDYENHYLSFQSFSQYFGKQMQFQNL